MWTLIITTTAFVALVGIVGGGGELVNAQSNARRVAEQAARAGADELSEAAARSGTDNVNTGDAIARANKILTASGWSGSVRVEGSPTGSRVVVTATGTRTPRFLRLLGVQTVHINETGTADAISSPHG